MYKISKYLCLIIICLLSIMNTKDCFAATNLDEIMEYTIQVDTREDGTLDIKYHLVWKVLDDKKDGPLTWVKIGIPNKHVDEIKGLSDNVDKIKYYNSSGTYVRIDFDKKYYKDEIVVFDFSIHQSYMYRTNNSANEYTYSFTPGWFDEIQVNSITLKWNQEDVMRADTSIMEDGYYIWTDSLKNGERLEINVAYSLDSLLVNEAGQESSVDVAGIITIIILFFGGFIGLCIWVARKDDYTKHSGLGGGKRKSAPRTNHRSGGCVHSCACACACACAGGGRAGCSTKDFYHTNLQTLELKKVLNK